jgi:hypothetical protein
LQGSSVFASHILSFDKLRAAYAFHLKPFTSFEPQRHCGTGVHSGFAKIDLLKYTKKLLTHSADSSFVGMTTSSLKPYTLGLTP